LAERVAQADKVKPGSDTGRAGISQIDLAINPADMAEAGSQEIIRTAVPTDLFGRASRHLSFLTVSNNRLPELLPLFVILRYLCHGNPLYSHE
jgi:hypothetical protein